MEKIIKKINRLLQTKSIFVVGIDGPCASGKTTLAKKIAAETGAQVIHIDDFFLPAKMRTADSLNTIGGNIDTARFVDEISRGISLKIPTEYGIYDCKEGRITKIKTLKPEGIIIIEGAYSNLPELCIDYDLKIFVEAPLSVRLNRIQARNADSLNSFINIWIPLENKYFEAYPIKESCDFIVE
ncbi:MAG: (d)CMP kinase [Clostridia bacterium]|nr:(d)CMP kinase [Clostridia bacterium]